MCFGEQVTPTEFENSLNSAGLVSSDDLGNLWENNSDDQSSALQSEVNAALITDNSGGACPMTDISLPYGITLQSTDLCPMFDILKMVVLVFAYITAGTIVFGALVRES